jgi:hypothetical protein
MPPVPRNLLQLRQRIMEAVAAINHQMLQHIGRNLIAGLTSAASSRVDISSTCNIGQKLGVSFPLLTCSPLVWPSWLLYGRGQKSWRDLRITLYIDQKTAEFGMCRSTPKLLDSSFFWIVSQYSQASISSECSDQEITYFGMCRSTQKLLDPFPFWMIS